MTDFIAPNNLIVDYSPLAEVTQVVQTGISPRALAIAREIDRLPPGEYGLHLEKKTAAAGGGLYYELVQETTLRARELK